MRTGGQRRRGRDRDLGALALDLVKVGLTQEVTRDGSKMRSPLEVLTFHENLLKSRVPSELLNLHVEREDGSGHGNENRERKEEEDWQRHLRISRLETAHRSRYEKFHSGSQSELCAVIARQLQGSRDQCIDRVATALYTGDNTADAICPGEYDELDEHDGKGSDRPTHQARIAMAAKLLRTLVLNR